MNLSRILITPGEPAGIGPDVMIQAAQLNFNAELIAIADPDIILERAAMIGLPLKLIECDLDHLKHSPHQAGSLYIHPVTFSGNVIAGQLNPENANDVIRCLQIASHACLMHQADAIVTGPAHKSVINDAGIPFTGHTEFFAQQTGSEQTVMLFVVDNLKVALVTTHLPLKDVAASITSQKITDVVTILHDHLKKYFKIHTPRILISGLNPHAGEMGHLGREEIDIIQPALDQLRSHGLQIEGPLPADTLFTPDMIRKADAIVGMYHDQMLPVIKYIGFDRAVNLTLGLPFVRTSVDHGTALDIAGTGAANPGSMSAAIKLAITLTA